MFLLDLAIPIIEDLLYILLTQTCLTTMHHSYPVLKPNNALRVIKYQPSAQ